jgi:hypothetical protein
MDTISNRLVQQYPGDYKGWGAIAIPLCEHLIGDVRRKFLQTARISADTDVG